MKKTITLFSFLLVCIASFAQTDKAKQSLQQDESGKALKQWFDSGDIIIDAYMDKSQNVFIQTDANNGYGYWCAKIKINHILKGKLDTGYINIKSGIGQQIGEGAILDPEASNYYHNPNAVIGVGILEGRFIIKIKKSNLIKEGFVTENKGVYIAVGDVKYITGSEKPLYQMLQDYCGVDLSLLKTGSDGGKKVEKKSPKSTEVNKINDIPYEQREKNYKKYLESLNLRLSKAKTNKQKSLASITDLNVNFANPTIVGSNFEFDIMASSTGASTYLDNAIFNIQYNSAAFGTNAVANNKVTVTRGASFNNTTYIDPNPQLSNGIDTIGIPFGSDGTQSSWNRTLLTSTPVQLLHVSIKIQTCNLPAGLQFINTSFTSGFSWYVSNANADPNTAAVIIYDNVNYGTGLNTAIPACGLQISNCTPASVIAGAYYTGIPNNESKLTINGTGFGSTQGTVLMRNAVNNSAPLYIPLDSYDITSWTDNQIVVNVPSVLFPTIALPINSNYPGSGYVKVVPVGAITIDTAVSSIPVQIPYILKNRTTGGSSAKHRISFAYRNVIDSTGIADSAAYWFRFDIATVANNPNPFCRPLLKQAIKDWACELGIRYRIGKDTTITNTAPDGISYITFKSGTGADTLSNPNFIAETAPSVNFCNGNYYSTEADISFMLNPLSHGFPDWYYINPSLVPTGTATGTMPSGFTDFFEVALHELGHASLLLHVNDTSDLMYFKIFQNVPRSYISTNDQNGGIDNVVYSKTLIYPSSGCSYNPFRIPAAGSGACVSPTSGIESIGNNTFQLSVYPNPTSQVLNVTFVKEKESSNTIKLINIVGQTIFYKNIAKNYGANEIINISGFAKGTYILVVTDNQNTVYKKVIIE